LNHKRLVSTIATLIFSLVPSLQTIPAQSSYWTVPTLKSFDFSPKEIELASENTSLKISVVVNHPIGISSEKMTLHLKKGTNFDVAFDLSRTDKPMNASLKDVIFEGTIKLPNTLSSGVWKLSTEPVEGFAPPGSSLKPLSGEFTPKNFRDFTDAENALLVKLNGSLEFDFTTFVGPTFTAVSTISDDKPRTLSYKNPIWRVGEIFDPKEYFELRTSLVQLKIQSKTPTVCKQENDKLRLMSQGDCYYRVYTEKTSNFLAKEINLGATILSARVKPTLDIPKIEKQDSIGLPKEIVGKAVYYQGFPLTPENKTPRICIASKEKITIYSGGICELEYFVEESSTNLASEKYLQNFEITRVPQTIEFSPSTNTDLSAKTLLLSATTSSGAAVTFTAEPAANCSVTGTTLNLLKAGNCAVTAQQAGTATIAPISKTVTISITGKAAKELRTISCVKGSKKVSVTRAKPKCPKGYSRVR